MVRRNMLTHSSGAGRRPKDPFTGQVKLAQRLQ